MSKEQLYVKRGRKYFPVEHWRGIDNEIVLFCAFRYALGRMTYVVGSVADAIRKASEVMSQIEKSKYVQEIVEHYTSEGAIGMQMDTEVWAKLACFLDEGNVFSFEANYYNTDKWDTFSGFMFNGMLYSRESYNTYHTVRNIEKEKSNFPEFLTQIFTHEVFK